MTAHCCVEGFITYLNGSSPTRCSGGMVGRPPSDAQQRVTVGATGFRKPRPFGFIRLYTQENLQRMQIWPATLRNQHSSCLSGTVRAHVYYGSCLLIILMLSFLSRRSLLNRSTRSVSVFFRSSFCLDMKHFKWLCRVWLCVFGTHRDETLCAVHTV